MWDFTRRKQRCTTRPRSLAAWWAHLPLMGPFTSFFGSMNVW
jgi:hypothetical protein